MMKNDYRRSLIMLRTHAQGYSGHVRLERRTLMGTMYVMINAPGDGSVLCASLVRRNNRGEYVAVKLGELRRDGRGQASLAYSFDPRNIEGAALEEYWLIAIVARDPLGRCSVVLSGNVNGSREVDWDAVQAAACAACRLPVCENCPPPVSIPARPGEGPLGPQTPALPPVDIPARPGEGPLNPPTPTLPPPDAPAAPGEGPLNPPTPTVPDGAPAQPGEGPAELPTPSLPDGTPAAPGIGPLNPPTPDLTAIPEEIPSDGFQPADDLPEGLPLPTTFAPASATAAELLGLDSSVPWPGVAEQVRSYFTQPPKELMPGDGYTYVSAPMPAGSGYDHVEVGIRAEDGVPISVAYALPSRFTPEPPPGLEDYVWKGGAADGWWVIETDNYTGERMI